MADNDLTQATGPDEMAPSATSVEGDPVAQQGFFKTTAGRILLIGGAISLLLGVAAVVVFLVVTFIFVDAVEDVASQVQNQVGQVAQSQAASGTPSGQGSASEESPGAGEAYTHQSVRLTSVHVWRDIFQPLTTPVSEEATDTAPPDDTTDTGSTGQYQADTLYLLEILTGSSETAAQFYFDGIDYNTTTEFTSRDYIVVKEGERLEDTPWRLLSIGVTSVTLQYGDSTVTLGLGQGIRK